jgi:acyl-CoA synthetase (AMP-forming)/AMP-acid ligase II
VPPPSETLNDLLERAAGLPEFGLRFLDRHEEATFLTWREIRAQAHRVAGGLVALGLQPGERAALVFPTGPEFFAAFFGVLLAGGVPTPLYPPVRLGRLDEYHARTARMIEAASARVVLTDGRVRRLLGQTMERARPPLGCQRLSDLSGSAPPGRGDQGEGLPEIHPEDLALVQFSSGTTVDPKPVALSHRAVVAQTRLLNGFWPDADGVHHSGVSWLPLYHDMGLIGCVFPALERPTELTLIGPEVFVSRPAVWLRAISRYGATVSPAPNFAYGLCVDKVRDAELEGVDLSCWRVALNGAESVAPGVLRKFQQRFARWGFRPEALTPVYGLSEAALAVTFSDLAQPFTSRRFDRRALATQGEARPSLPGDPGEAAEPTGPGAEIAAEASSELVSLGHPLPGFVLEIRNEDGETQPEGRVGRLWVRGPSLMDGYLDQPEATAAVLRDGWLNTGDLGFLLEDELYLTGRAKDILLIRGRNIAPQQAEQAVDGVAGVRTGCAVAVSHLPDGGEGEVLTLLVEAAQGAPAEARERLPEACRKAVLAAVGVAPTAVEILAPGTLPRTSSGKLRRGEALQLYLAGKLRPPDPVNPLRLAVAMGRSSLAFARHRRAPSEEPDV